MPIPFHISTPKFAHIDSSTELSCSKHFLPKSCVETASCFYFICVVFPWWPVRSVSYHVFDLSGPPAPSRGGMCVTTYQYGFLNDAPCPSYHRQSWTGNLKKERKDQWQRETVTLERRHSEATSLTNGRTLIPGNRINSVHVNPDTRHQEAHNTASVCPTQTAAPKSNQTNPKWWTFYAITGLLLCKTIKFMKDKSLE